MLFDFGSFGVYGDMRIYCGVYMRKRFLILLLFLGMFYGAPTLSFSREVSDAVVTIFAHCVYELKPLRYIGEAELFTGDKSGVGFIVDHDNVDSKERIEKIVTVGHVASCQPRAGRDFPGYEVVSFKPAELYVVVGTMTYPATVKKVFINPNEGLQDPDKALVEIRLPRSIRHDHIPLIKRYVPTVGDEVVVVGLVPKRIPEGTILRSVYKKAFVEMVFPAFIQVGMRAFPGMSGSPVIVERRMLWWKRKYAIGTVSMNDENGNGFLLDLFFAATVDRKFLE